MTTASPTDRDAEARRALARHRSFATALLLLMAALTLASYALPPDWPADLLQASAKAGFVGGIADWFAVTALFRRPLGLPIPHTAIIPAQKVRLGKALGGFIANHVFTPAEVSRTLDRLDVPGLLHRFLAEPAQARPLADAVAGMLPRLLGTIEDGRAKRLLARLVPRLLGGAGAGMVVAQALRGLVEGGRHQEVFGFILAQVRSGMLGREGQLRVVIEERVREQGGRLVGWVLGASIARRVLLSVGAELDKMSPDGSELRLAFDEWVKHEITRMEEDPARAREVGAAIARVVAHETVQAWMWDIWGRLRRALESDAANPRGRAIGMLESALADLGRQLESDPALRRQVQEAVARMVAGLLPSARVQLADFIADVVAHWDTDTIVDRLELRVGRDLQYVRINGTLVGFLAGGLVYAALRATFGYVR